jgi:hypothetical protein
MFLSKVNSEIDDAILGALVRLDRKYERGHLGH